MKIGEIREMTAEEIQEKLRSLREELFNMRFQHGIGQLENPKKMFHARKDIARLETVMSQLTLENKQA